jgi:hypothetical protein
MDRLASMLLKFPTFCALCSRPLWPGDFVHMVRLTFKPASRAFYCDRERCTARARERAAELEGRERVD